MTETSTNGARATGRAATARAMTVLAIDTATDTVVTGLVRVTVLLDSAAPADTGTAGTRTAVPGIDGSGTTGAGGATLTLLAERSVADGRRHAEILTTLIAETLAEAGVRRADIDAVVVGTGPGPFTGLRVGMATAAGFADALGIPAIGVGSLSAIAADVRRRHDAAATVLVATDARRREVYWLLDGPGAGDRQPRVAAPPAVAAALAGQRIDAVGGSAAHLAQIGWDGDDPAAQVPSVTGLVTAAVPALAAGGDPGPLVPAYLRRPDAVEQRDRAPKAVSTP